VAVGQCEVGEEVVRRYDLAHREIRDRRLRQLRAFWERITDRKIWAFTPDGDIFRKARNATSSWMTMMQGQPGFLSPRLPNPRLSFAGAQSATSCYSSIRSGSKCPRPAPASSCMTCTARKSSGEHLRLG
jgi:hypothetical protein